MDKEGEIELPAVVVNYTGVEYRGITRSVLTSERPVIKVIDPNRKTPVSLVPASEVTQNPTETPAVIPVTTIEGTPVPQEETTSFWQKILNKLKGTDTEAPSSDEAVTPTETPITPDFESLYAIGILLIVAAFRRI